MVNHHSRIFGLTPVSVFVFRPEQWVKNSARTHFPETGLMYINDMLITPATYTGIAYYVPAIQTY